MDAIPKRFVFQLTILNNAEVAEVLITVGPAGCGAAEAEALTSAKCQEEAAAVSSYDDSENDNTCPTG